MKILFYQDKNGSCDILDYLHDLRLRYDKNSRINLKKIDEYITILRNYGKSAGEPYMKHLQDEIWELRPIDNRILFAAFDNDNGMILLHFFIKTTRKTPQREIDMAKRNLDDLIKRGII